MTSRMRVAVSLILLTCAAPLRAEPIVPGPEAHDGTAKNVILFLGDGMGVTTVTAARIRVGGAAHELTLDRLPFTAVSRTYSTSHQVTDSAAGMNAPMTGRKTANAAIAMDASGHPLPTFLELAEAAGKRTGIVTTTTVTHATPASCYAHIDARNKETAIAEQLVPGTAGYNPALGDGLEVILGGGRKFFVPRDDAGGAPVHDEEGDPGAREDGRDLRAEMQAAGYAYVWNADQLAALDLATTDNLLGLFEAGHLPFEVQRGPDSAGEPTLPQLTAAAITVLQKSDNGFFLMVEGGRIDHGHHGNSAYAALTEVVMFDAAIQTAINMVDLSDTLILVTADHSHVLTLAGYAPRGTSIFGEAGTDTTGVPYTTLSYANGPGYRGNTPRVAPADDEFPGVLGQPPPKDPTHSTYVQEAGVPLPSETHGGEDVIIWAVGAGAGRVRGVVENTQIFHWMRAASGL